MKSRFYTALKYLIGWPISFLAFFYIIKLIAPHSNALLQSFMNANYLLLFYGVIFFVLFYFLRSYIWHRIIRKKAKGITYKETSHLWAMSELKRYAPGNIWSLVGRTVLFAEKGVEKKHIASLLVIEAELFVIAGLFVSLLGVPFLTFLHIPDVRIIIFYLLCLGTLVYLFNKSWLHRIPEKLQGALHFLLPTLHPNETLFLIFLNIVSLLFFGLGYYFVISSLSFLDPLRVSELIGFFVFAFIFGYLSLLTPAGFGVREGLLIAGLVQLIPSETAAFTVLAARIMLILAELIFIALSSFIYKTKNRAVLMLEQFFAKYKHETVLLFLFLLFVIYFTTAGFLKYDNFYAGRFDLGNMAQTVWNTAHGRFFIFTNPNGTDPISRLAFHADFLLILLAPFYLIWSDPKMLVLIQTLVVGSGAFFVYFLAKDILKNKAIALTLAFIFLLNPSVQRTDMYDFHAVTLATTFLLGTFYFYRKKQYGFFMLFAVLSAFCKEQLWLIVAMFGLFLFFFQKRRIFGAFLFIFSALTFYFLIWYAIPKTLGSQHFALSYYSDFGDSPTKIVKTFLLSPQKILATATEPDRIHFLKQLFGPLGYLSLFAPVVLIFAVPDFLITLLSNNAQLHQIYYQYPATITPFLFIAAIYGIWVIKKFLPKIPYALFILYLLFMSFLATYFDGPLPGAKQPDIAMITRQLENRDFIANYVAHIPKRYSVASSNNIGSHLSQRQQIYTLPLGVDKADVIVMLLTDTEYGPSLEVEKKQAEQLKHDPNYVMEVNQDKFLVFRKKNVDYHVKPSNRTSR